MGGPRPGSWRQRESKMGQRQQRGQGAWARQGQPGELTSEAVGARWSSRVGWIGGGRYQERGDGAKGPRGGVEAMVRSREGPQGMRK
jgi:hypothetical protein